MPIESLPISKKELQGKKILAKYWFPLLFISPCQDENQMFCDIAVCPTGIFGCINFSNYWKFYVRRFTGKNDPNFLRHQGLLWGWRRTVNVPKHLAFFLWCAPIQMGPICSCNSDHYTRNNATEESGKSPPSKNQFVLLVKLSQGLRCMVGIQIWHMAIKITYTCEWKLGWWGWKDSSLVKGTHCCTESTNSTPAPTSGGSQSPLTLAPEGLTPSSGVLAWNLEDS